MAACKPCTTMSLVTPPTHCSYSPDIFTVAAVVSQVQSIWQTLLDMFTGRYLWHAYVDWREAGSTQRAA